MNVNKAINTVISLALVSATFLAQAQPEEYPTKPIRLVVPFPAGGPTDIVARPLAILLGKALKQQVIVDNKGGAGGSVGADYVAKAEPDGYTLLLGTVGTNAINGSLYKSLPYDVARDFTPLSLVASAPLTIVVNPSYPIKSLKDLINASKNNPESINYGTAGNGTPGHLTAALFESQTQIKLKHIPYKGSAQGITDLIGGQIPLMFDPIQSTIPHIKSGSITALAVTSKARSPALPNIPTVAELGYPQFESTAWWAIFGPAKLPPNITQELRSALEKITSSTEYREQVSPLGIVPHAHFNEPLAAFQAREIAKWSKAVKDSSATID